MPFNLHIPLPGPFSYNKRLGKSRKPGEHGATWWLFIGWWVMPIVWLLAGTVWFTILICRVTINLTRTAVLYWAANQNTTGGRHR